MPSINGLLTVWRNCMEDQENNINCLINCNNCKLMTVINLYDRRTICDTFKKIEGLP